MQQLYPTKAPLITTSRRRKDVQPWQEHAELQEQGLDQQTQGRPEGSHATTQRRQVSLVCSIAVLCIVPTQS